MYPDLKPVGPVPNARQMEWFQRGASAFLHYGMNTFTDSEWGSGQTPLSAFAAQTIDCDQWVRTVKEAGFTCAIMNAKHHDGFCMWPSAYTDYCVKNTAYKNGQGDIIREFVDACEKYGIKAGLYLSPWDIHSDLWGTPAYNDYYANQLTELMTNYGKIYECWWDGAGSTADCDWARWADIIHTLQPDCIIFGSFSAAPYVDVRWVGNEVGAAGDPCWGTIDLDAIIREDTKLLNSGLPNGTHYIPAESDVSIRPGWFYHSEHDQYVKTPGELVRYWFASAGRNTGILLNLPPNREGVLHPNDVKNVTEWGNLLKTVFSKNFAAGSTVTASSTLGDHAPAHVLDGTFDTFYAAEELTPSMEFALDGPQTFNCYILQEGIEYGERIRRFALDAYVNGAWQTVCEKQSVGYCRADYFAPVTTDRVRIRVLEATAAPVLRSFGIYHMPEAVLSQTQQGNSGVDLLQSKAAKVLVNGNELVMQLGGIFSFNTVVFDGTGIEEYELYSFDGFSYDKIYSGTHPSAHETCQFETVHASYQLMMRIVKGTPGERHVEVYCME